jgi:AbrB family looped-hinge helix DNA binding protein
MRVTVKGQVTIPRVIREQLGITPNSDVEFVVEGKRVYLRKGEVAPPGNQVLAILAGSANARLSTDEILQLTRGDE